MNTSLFTTLNLKYEYLDNPDERSKFHIYVINFKEYYDINVVDYLEETNITLSLKKSNVENLFGLIKGLLKELAGSYAYGLELNIKSKNITLISEFFFDDECEFDNDEFEEKMINNLKIFDSLNIEENEIVAKEINLIEKKTKLIQKQLKESMYNPQYKMCQNIMKRDFEKIEK